MYQATQDSFALFRMSEAKFDFAIHMEICNHFNFHISFKQFYTRNENDFVLSWLFFFVGSIAIASIRKFISLTFCTLFDFNSNFYESITSFNTFRFRSISFKVITFI